MKDLNQKVSSIIKSIREAKGFSQSYIAKKLNITQQAYSALEKQPESMSLKRLYDLANVLQVEIVLLLGIEKDYIQHNFNQQGGYAATQMVNNYSTQEKNELYERIIAELKEEIAYLRSLNK